MSDELEQLLRNLHLAKMVEIIDQEIHTATKQDISYGGSSATTAPRTVASPPGDRAGLAHQTRGSSRGVDARVVSLRQAARCLAQAIPQLRRTGFHRTRRKHRADRGHRQREDRPGYRSLAQSAAKRLPRNVCPRTGSIRRDVRVAGRPHLAQADQSAGAR